MSTFILNEPVYKVLPSGKPARVVSTHGPSDAPIVAVVLVGGETKGSEMLMCFNMEGEACTGHRLVLA